MKRILASIVLVVCLFLLQTPVLALPEGFIMDGTHYYPKQELYIDFDGDDIVYTVYCGSHDKIECLARRDKNNPLLVNEIQELQQKGLLKVIDTTNTAFLTEKPSNPNTIYIVLSVVAFTIIVIGGFIYVKRRRTIQKTSR